MSKITNAVGNIANGIKATKTIAQQQAEFNPIKAGGISSLGKAGINLAAGVAGELGKRYISNGFHTTAGDVIDTVGSTASTILPLIPGVGWAAAPIVLGASKLLSGVANAAFGSEYRDNGATAYTNWLNNLNTNVDNSQGVNLLASIGAGQQATSRNGWLNHSAERRADKTNENQALALEGFRRGINNSFLNNNWLQT